MNEIAQMFELQQSGTLFGAFGGLGLALLGAGLACCAQRHSAPPRASGIAGEAGTGPAVRGPQHSLVKY